VAPVAAPAVASVAEAPAAAPASASVAIATPAPVAAAAPAPAPVADLQHCTPSCTLQACNGLKVIQCVWHRLWHNNQQ
jgi:hypothetical protein